jgi:DNA-binding LytR/AlgR family response regulator
MIWPRLFPSLFREEKWTVGKEMVMMLWQIISVSFINLWLMHVLYSTPFSSTNIIQTLGITAAVGIFPVTLIILLKQQMLLKKYSVGAVKLEQQLQTEVKEVKEVQAEIQHITLTGDNQNESLTVPVQQIRYISSADNYIKVYYVEDDKLTSKVLRSTLKKAESIASKYPQLFRCHRTYLVNLGAVDHVSGNAQGYKLHLKNTPDLIPVSRSLNHQLTEQIQKYSTLSH